MILLIIPLNISLGNESKINFFFLGFKCHLRIDLDQVVVQLYNARKILSWP